MTLQKGLIAHWTFDSEDTVGSTARDVSGGMNHGAINGSPTTGASGRVDDAMRFSGLNSGEYINTPGPSLPQKFSISFWLYPNALDVDSNNNYRQLVSNGNFILIEQSGAISFRVPGVDTGYWGAGSITTGSWTHVTCIYDQSDRIIYINGSEAGRDNIGPGTPSGGVGYLAGPDSVHQYNGILDDVRVYNRVLSKNEINEIMNLRTRRTARV